MTWPSMLERAIAIAAEAHADQLDKGGAPYFLHPLRMMLRLSSTDERIVATLHAHIECSELRGPALPLRLFRSGP